jgi:WD40 repeat protein
MKAITYHPSGNLLVAGLLDGKLLVLSGAQRSTIATLQGPDAGITNARFSPDGRFLAVASRDGKVYLWSSANWKMSPLVFEENNGFIMSVCFSDNSNYFYSGSVDFPRLIGRPVSSDAMARDFCSLLSRNLTQEEWLEYIGSDIPYRLTCPDQ